MISYSTRKWLKENHRKKYKYVKSPKDDDTCALCLEKFKKGDQVVRLPCGHIFHGKKGCECAGVFTHLENHKECPLCRAVVEKGVKSGHFKKVATLAQKYF